MTINRGLTHDDIRDVAIRIIDELVKCKLVKDCIDSDDETEFEIQDTITKHLEFLAKD